MTTAKALSYTDRPWTQKYDKGVPARLDYPKVPLHQLLVDMAKKKPHDPVMLTTAKVPLFGRLTSSMSFAELESASDAVAAALVEMGLKKGEAVAIMMPNCAAFGICFFGVLKAGGVVAATNPTYPPDKLEYQLNDCDARFVFTLSLFYNTLKQVQKNTKVQHIIVANIKEYLPFIARLLFTLAREKKDGHRIDYLQQGDMWFQDILKKYAGRKVQVSVIPDDLALFQYTGGTTGVSKAAMSNHRALVANMLQIGSIVNVIGIPPDKHISLAAIPLFHVYGLVAALSLTIYTGSKMVLVVNARDIEEVIDCIDHYKPTLFPGVPALYNAINNSPRILAGKADLSSLKFCISGSAPLPTTTKEEFERLSGAKVREGFGMSEVPTATHVNPIFGENRMNSIGLPLPDVECRIVDLDDGTHDVPVGEAGELIIHAPNMMVGYHGMPTETANVLREKEGKKWMYTGDIARMDEDGYFYIVDRKKDMALIGGYNVYPTVVENVLKSHPAVLEVGVAAVPHPEKEGQEALKAWVVKKPDMNVTEQELIDHCGSKLAPYEIPRRIAFIPELPKTIVGKTLRRELIRLEVEGRAKN